jgi:hypothetical protein
VAVELGAHLALVAIDDELQRGVVATRARRSGDHSGRAAIAAHGVDGDARACGHCEALAA